MTGLWMVLTGRFLESDQVIGHARPDSSAC
jgi:hypothetical protein